MSDTRKFSRQNRKNPTKEEQKIWNLLKNRQIKYKFRRQHPIDKYIVDFVCLERRLIIECDGGQHSEETDKERTDFLISKGYKILRFWNIDIIRNIESVYSVILYNLSD
ncbi:histidinol dehydrogenase/primosomal protein N' (replication factor Y) (superfamily II helicase) [Parelusimicrobium proximum]|uniref:endonuclease domain-containing protein n=1 Tax=Parelusimicrobium proximum TaxID=3228953 RepID=UPI003D1738D5